MISSWKCLQNKTILIKSNSIAKCQYNFTAKCQSNFIAKCQSNFIAKCQYNFIAKCQSNFIAKCQYNCTRNVLRCHVHSSHIQGRMGKTNQWEVSSWENYLDKKARGDLLERL